MEKIQSNPADDFQQTHQAYATNAQIYYTPTMLNENQTASNDFSNYYFQTQFYQPYNVYNYPNYFATASNTQPLSVTTVESSMAKLSDSTSTSSSSSPISSAHHFSTSTSKSSLHSSASTSPQNAFKTSSTSFIYPTPPSSDIDSFTSYLSNTNDKSLDNSSLNQSQAKHDESSDDSKVNSFTDDKQNVQQKPVVIKDNNSRTKRRSRIQFTKEQIDCLEAVFNKSHYPEVHVVDRLSDKLSLSIERISVWFQNRRAKFKKTKKSSSTSGGMSSELSEMSNEAKNYLISDILSKTTHHTYNTTYGYHHNMSSSSVPAASIYTYGANGSKDLTPPTGNWLDFQPNSYLIKN